MTVAKEKVFNIMNKYRGKKPRLVKRGIGKLRTKSISISPKMKIDNSNLEHATRQFFEKVALLDGTPI